MIDIPKDIPNRSDFPQVKKLDRQIIRAAVLLGLDNQSAFALYHPEYLDGKGRLNDVGKKESGHFWSYGKNREYREAYEKCVEEFFNGSKRKTPTTSREVTEEEKVAAINSLCRYVVDNAIEIEKLEDPTMLLKTADKVKLFDIIEKQEIRPIRVLPTLCKSECRYRLFCETAKADGLAIDDCDYCKARAYAEERGFKYDPTTVLDLPEDVIAKIDEHNNVKLTDILDGKIEN